MAELWLLYAFWATVGCAAFGGLLGIAGIWIPSFWQSPTDGPSIGVKLVTTDVVLTITCLIVTVILKLLG